MVIDEKGVVDRARSLVGGDFAAEIRGHVRTANRLLRRLQKAEDQGWRAAIRRDQNHALHSHSVRLCAVTLCADSSPNLCAADLHQAARELDPYSDPGEAVRAWAKTKSLRGDWRPICSFGPKRRALQTLSSFILDARFGAHPLDYMAKGRGMEAVVDRIIELTHAGHTWFVLADVRNNFGSVEHEGIAAKLDLPQTVVRHSLFIGEEVPLDIPHVLPIDTCPTAFAETVRRGIPQGARSSNRVMAQLLGPDLETVAPAAQCILYGDDALLAAQSRKEAEAFSYTLQEALASHPAGPFQLKRLEVANIDVGFNFLSYHFRRDHFTGAVKVRPSTLSYHRFKEKVRAVILREDASCLYEAVMSYRKHWLAAFPRYARTKEQEVQALDLLWHYAIDGLPPFIRRKWDRACEVFLASGLPAPGTCDDWLEASKSFVHADA